MVKNKTIEERIENIESKITYIFLLLGVIGGNNIRDFLSGINIQPAKAFLINFFTHLF